MYENILYPTDGSEGAEDAVDNVQALAAAFDATVHVLSVVDARHADYGLSGAFSIEEESGLSADPETEGAGRGMVGGGADAEETRTALVERGEEIVDRAAASIGGGVTTETAVVTGIPHEAILEYADANAVDLVVMGTHGRTGIERYLLGSVTEKVVRLSDVPVLTVRADEAE